LKLLGIDTTSNVATVAIFEDDKCIGEMMLNHPKTHSQKMMPLIDALMNALELEIKDLDGIAISAGPGSFTGVRIGMATAKALAHASGLPLYSISALEAMAYNVPAYNGLVCPIMDARRDQVYTAVFELTGQKVERTLEDASLSISELITELKKSSHSVLFLGDGIVRFKETIVNELGDRALFAPDHLRMQKASSVCYAISQKIDETKQTGYSEVVPNYLRKSQAEREYDEKRKGL